MCRPRILFDVTFGVCWACLATLGPVWASLLELVVGFCVIFLKSVVLQIRCPSRVEVLYLQVPASKLEPLGLKSRTVEPLWRLFGALASVEFEVLCRSYGNRRTRPEPSPELDHVGGQSLSKRQ